MRFAYAYLGLTFCVWLAAVALWIVTHQPELSPLVRYAPCVQLILGPTPAWDCDGDNHRWYFQDGEWFDGGLLSPVPPVPQS